MYFLNMILGCVNDTSSILTCFACYCVLNMFIHVQLEDKNKTNGKNTPSAYQFNFFPQNWSKMIRVKAKIIGSVRKSETSIILFKANNFNMINL